MNRSLESLKTFLDTRESTFPWAPNPGVVVVGSGKGGVGTSTVSALLALAGARESRHVLLVDGDESAGSLHHLLGLPNPSLGLGDLKGGSLVPTDLLHPLGDFLWFLPGGGGGSEATLAASVGERRALLQRVTGLFQEFELVVLDGGSHLTSVLAACSIRPERLIALTIRDRVAMAATHALLKVVRGRFPEVPLEIVVNQGDAAVSLDVFRMMSEASRRFLGFQPAFGGSVPCDPALMTLSEEGVDLFSLDSSSPASDALAALHGRIAIEQESLRNGLPHPSVLAFPS